MHHTVRGAIFRPLVDVVGSHGFSWQELHVEIQSRRWVASIQGNARDRLKAPPKLMLGEGRRWHGYRGFVRLIGVLEQHSVVVHRWSEVSRKNQGCGQGRWRRSSRRFRQAVVVRVRQ